MFKFFKRNKIDPEEAKAKKSKATFLYNRFEDSLDLTYDKNNVRLKENKVWLEILSHDKMIQEEVGLAALEKLMNKSKSDYLFELIRRKIFKTTFNAKTSPSKESVIKLFDKLRKPNVYFYHLKADDILFCFKYYKLEFGKDEHYMDARDNLIHAFNKQTRHPFLKLMSAGLIKLDDDTNDNSIYDRRDELGIFLDSQWDEYDEKYKEIIAHCWGQTAKTKPSVKWRNKTQDLIVQSKKSELHNQFDIAILELLIRLVKAEVKWRNELSPQELWMIRNDPFIYESNEVAIRYFVWYAAMKDHPVVNTLVGQLALSFYSKIKTIGCLSTKNGNACMYACGIMSPKAGITQLLNISNKTNNKAIKNTAKKEIARKAESLNISEDMLLEMSVPEFNLEGNLSKWVIGDYTAVIDIKDLKYPISYWINNNSKKKQKSIPKAIKELHKEELKVFKSTSKDLKAAISVHAKRLENSYLENIEWNIQDWKRNYINHPLLSRYASKLIWVFDENKTAIVKEDKLVDANKNELNVNKYEKVKLWHPINSEIETSIAWRNYILEEQIKQPFKQAYREIYVVTDAEITTNTYSNRFAAHILYQSQFTALAKNRDWRYAQQGRFDGSNVPFKSIPKFELRAQFWVEPINDVINDSGVFFTYITSDQVRIYSGRELLQMADVPKIVFSEIMRDVDLFVGVTSIGNNPEWEDVGERRNYWQSYSFGDLNETAKTRKDVLERILPKLKISDRCSLGDKFLTVQGKIRNYKIHLGSGNILMTPNDQYLCIVPNSRDAKTKIFLPFDNDRTLSIIISKAFLLYDDDKIKDASILRQIKI